MSSKHVDLTRPTDAHYMGRKVPPINAHAAPLTAEYDSDGIPWSYGYEADAAGGTWTPGEVPPDLPTHTWHDVWSGDPETDKAWAHNVD